MSYWFSFLFPWLLVMWLAQVLASSLRARLSSDLKRDQRRALVQTVAARLRWLKGEAGSQPASGSLPEGGQDAQEGRAEAWATTGWHGLLWLSVAAAVVVWLPLRGIPLGRWVAGLNLQPSVPLLGLLAGRVWKNSCQADFFRPKDREAGWIFGGLFGTALYPLALGLGGFDPYSWGWGFSILFLIIAVLTILLIWKQNRFGLLLFLAIVGYDLRWLESPNFWDYLVDPVYWLVSLALLAKSVLKRIRRRASGCPVENSGCSLFSLEQPENHEKLR